MKILLLILALTPLLGYSQKKIVLTKDSVSATYSIEEDSLNVLEGVQINNRSDQTIYIPDIENRAIYFAALKSTLFSHFGVMNSILGAPNLSLEVRLIQILPKGKFDFSIKIPKSGSKITNYYFAFDYVTAIEPEKRAGELIISMEKYAALNKHAIRQINDK